MLPINLNWHVHTKYMCFWPPTIAHLVIQLTKSMITLVWSNLYADWTKRNITNLVNFLLLRTGFYCINSQYPKHSFPEKNLYNHAKLRQNINNHALCLWTIFLGSSRLPWTWKISRTKRSWHISSWEQSFFRIAVV